MVRTVGNSLMEQAQLINQVHRMDTVHRMMVHRQQMAVCRRTEALHPICQAIAKRMVVAVVTVVHLIFQLQGDCSQFVVVLMTHPQMDIRTAEDLISLEVEQAVALALVRALDCNLLIIHESNHSMHTVQHIDRELQLVRMVRVALQAYHQQMLLMDSEIYSNCHLAYVWSDVTQCDQVKV